MEVIPTFREVCVLHHIVLSDLWGQSEEVSDTIIERVFYGQPVPFFCAKLAVTALSMVIGKSYTLDTVYVTLTSPTMDEIKSEVFAVLEEINRTYQSCQDALKGFAEVGNHEHLTKVQLSIAEQVVVLGEKLGDEAVNLLFEHMANDSPMGANL